LAIPEFQMAKSSSPSDQPGLPKAATSEQTTLTYSTRSWYRSVEQAITGLHAGGLLQRVYAAEEAIHNRWTGMTDSLSDKKERQAMEAATEKLRDIRIYVLGWPGL
jgi:hypothetical protein